MREQQRPVHEWAQLDKLDLHHAAGDQWERA